jgi:hypothetical protein
MISIIFIFDFKLYRYVIITFCKLRVEWVFWFFFAYMKAYISGYVDHSLFPYPKNQDINTIWPCLLTHTKNNNKNNTNQKNKTTDKQTNNNNKNTKKKNQQQTYKNRKWKQFRKKLFILLLFVFQIFGHSHSYDFVNIIIHCDDQCNK